MFDYKVSKIDDVIGLSPNHVFSSNNGHKYYISMNFKVFVIPTNSRDSKENFKLWHDIFRLLEFIL